MKFARKITRVNITKNNYEKLKLITLNVSVLIFVIFVQDTRCYTYKESLASIN